MTVASYIVLSSLTERPSSRLVTRTFAAGPAAVVGVMTDWGSSDGPQLTVASPTIKDAITAKRRFLIRISFDAGMSGVRRRLLEGPCRTTNRDLPLAVPPLQAPVRRAPPVRDGPR